MGRARWYIAYTCAYDDAFGVIKDADEDETPGDANPFLYTGQYYGREAKSYYFRARCYNPALGRFLQVDPIRDKLNWYILLRE